MLRWTPEIYSTSKDNATATEPQEHLLRAWLMVSDGRYLVILCIDLDLHVPLNRRARSLPTMTWAPNLAKPHSSTLLALMNMRLSSRVQAYKLPSFL
ncbi:hypothetical protein GJ744_011130 [Endocarpon pusillum]|uniref:Uncharacterized protein n=1 Tax=Endocarpon pusillum TaxID=364733 RepID=A0A8H7E1A4_9EURO|nr:hypothetical protein GJ744_011130 [Endocarpon pusillum]